MSKRITNEQIISSAKELIAEKGYNQFSLRELSARLNIKPASLYNHVNGIDEIVMLVGLDASILLRDILKKTAENKMDDVAFVDCCYAYRKFAKENPESYKALISIPKSYDVEIQKASWDSFETLRSILLKYSLSNEDFVYFIRQLRAVMHGYIEIENAGFMIVDELSSDITYQRLIAQQLELLKELGEWKDEKQRD